MRQNESIGNIFKQGDAVIRHGIVLPEEHPTDPSLYKVNIGNMTASSSGRVEDGIWCTNNITPYTRFRDINNTPISYGQYFPLQPYMPVTVMLPSGGAGQGMVISPAKTNVGLPDPENRDHLHMVAQTPKGSWIAMDDRVGNIQLFYDEGNSSITLSEDNITMEIGKGETSGKVHGTSLSISNGSFVFRTRDSTMKFDESGLSVGFDSSEGQGKSSSFVLTRDSIRMDAGKNMQLNAQDSIAAQAEKITIEGIKDASVVGNHVKINGAQLTSIKGTQIELEAFWNVQLKGMYLGFEAKILHREVATMKHTKSIVNLKETNGIQVDQATSKATLVFTINSVSSPLNIVCTKWIPTAAATAASAAAYAGTKAATEATYYGLKAVGILWMVKTLPISIITNVMGTGTVMAAAGNRSENSSVFLFNAKDKGSKKSINSGIATSYAKKNRVMENLSVVDPLIQASMTAVSSGGKSPTASVISENQWILESGIGGQQEAATQKTVVSGWNKNIRNA